MTATSDRGCRMHSTLVLRTPVLTLKTLAAKLRVAPQTGTALLRDLQVNGLVREVTGRRSFQTFAM